MQVRPCWPNVTMAYSCANQTNYHLQNVSDFAAYSGDWSWIGAISKADEAWLQEVLPMLAVFHAFAAVVSGVVASRAGRPAVWPVAKASLVGGLAMFEQLLQVDD